MYEANGRHRLLRARRERPRCRPAEKRDELASSQSVELHLLAQTRGVCDSITDWQRSVRRLAALRKFGSPYL
jgi:hypothetical protein